MLGGQPSGARTVRQGCGRSHRATCDAEVAAAASKQKKKWWWIEAVTTRANGSRVERRGSMPNRRSRALPLNASARTTC